MEPKNVSISKETQDVFEGAKKFFEDFDEDEDEGEALPPGLKENEAEQVPPIPDHIRNLIKPVPKEEHLLKIYFAKEVNDSKELGENLNTSKKPPQKSSALQKGERRYSSKRTV